MREMQKVLYIGGFEMPDKNAAAQRVLSVAKIFRLLGYEVVFYGITKGDDFEGEVDGFRYEAREYPRSTAMWETYLFGYGILRYIKKINPSYIVLYNYPAIAQNRIIRYGRKHNIKVIGDITEWYNPHNPVKRFDTLLRMKWSNKRLDGIIAISKYLEKYYSRQKVLLLPPLIDKEEEKWTVTSKGSNENSIILVYAGTPGMKDRLDFIVKGLGEFDVGKFFLHIVGLTKEQFENNYHYAIGERELRNVRFYGRLPHREVIKLLKQSDFQIFFRENIRVNNAGFPTKFVESISAGVPVITNNVSNVADYIINGQNSFMIESPTIENISAVLHKVSMLTREQLDVMKKNCDNSMFDYRHFVDEVGCFIKRL